MDFLKVLELHIFNQNLQLIKYIAEEEDIDYNILLNILRNIYK